MRIVAINGSPRKQGTTAKHIHEFIQTMANERDAVEIYSLGDYPIGSCSGCEYCRSHEECSIDDSMQVLREAIRSADVVIIGTPSYFGQMTGLLKKFCDRLYPEYRGKGVSKLKGKPLYLIYTQHSDPEVYADYRVATNRALYGFLGFDIRKTLVNGIEVEV